VTSQKSAPFDLTFGLVTGDSPLGSSIFQRNSAALAAVESKFSFRAHMGQIQTLSYDESNNKYLSHRWQT
jgi:hypothetical protein